MFGALDDWPFVDALNLHPFGLFFDAFRMGFFDFDVRFWINLGIGFIRFPALTTPHHIHSLSVFEQGRKLHSV